MDTSATSESDTGTAGEPPTTMGDDPSTTEGTSTPLPSETPVVSETTTITGPTLAAGAPPGRSPVVTRQKRKRQEMASGNSTTSSKENELETTKKAKCPELTGTATQDGSLSALDNDNASTNDDNPAESGTMASERRAKTSKRWRVHQMAEDYVELASNMMLFPTTHLGPYGYPDNQHRNHQGSGQNGAAPNNKDKNNYYPLELISSLGYLKSSLRRPTIIETWSPYEIALFEASIGHYGKDFYQIHKAIQTKSTKEVIDFYYIWKKTSHYKTWKEQYVSPGELLPEEEECTTTMAAAASTNTPVKKPSSGTGGR